MNKNVMIAGGIVVLAVIVGVGAWMLMGKSEKKSETVSMGQNVEALPTPTAVSEASDAAVMTSGEVKSFTVEAGNFSFSPKVIKVKKGDNVKITFKNTEGFHDFVLDEFDVKTNQIGEGEEEDIEFVADKTGTFEYYCSVGNHRKMGMVGKLVVE